MPSLQVSLALFLAHPFPVQAGISIGAIAYSCSAAHSFLMKAKQASAAVVVALEQKPGFPGPVGAACPFAGD